MSTTFTDPSALPAELRRWRLRVFAATWLCYAGFYFCRKPFSIVKSTLKGELHFDATTLGNIGAVYLIAYAIGQFIAGWLGQRLGPRVNLLLGMGVSIAVGAGFGFSNSAAMFMAFSAINGLAQATGWSGTVGTMAQWFHRGERGRIMGLWATNFTVGSLVAGPFAAWVLGHYGFRASFFSGSMVLAAVWVFFLFNQRNRPEDVGFGPIDGPEAAAAEPEGRVRFSRATWTNILLIGLFYFFAKFIRYALWSWAPFFLTENFHQTSEQAGYLSTAFDVAGVPGVFLTGWLSDHVFGSRRALVSMLSMIGLTGALLLLCTVGLHGATAFTVCLMLVGLTLYGPDALMTGAGAMDVGSRRGAVAAAGIISGFGSLGPVVQELVIGKMYDNESGDLTPIFVMLLVSAACGTGALAWMVMRNRAGRADV